VALVVEDQPDYADFLAESLELQGLKAHVANDGEQGLDLALSLNPEIITLDLQMPRRTGISFFRLLRSHERCRETPIIVITGLTPGDPDMNLLIRSMLEPDHLVPPFAYLEKPVSPEKLRSTVLEALMGSQTR
jgi:CheY-like chemotaxis protein